MYLLEFFSLDNTDIKGIATQATKYTHTHISFTVLSDHYKAFPATSNYLSPLNTRKEGVWLVRFHTLVHTSYYLVRKGD